MKTKTHRVIESDNSKLIKRKQMSDVIINKASAATPEINFKNWESVPIGELFNKAEKNIISVIDSFETENHKFDLKKSNISENLTIHPKHINSKFNKMSAEQLYDYAAQSEPNRQELREYIKDCSEHFYQKMPDFMKRFDDKRKEKFRKLGIDNTDPLTAYGWYNPKKLDHITKSITDQERKVFHIINWILYLGSILAALYVQFIL